MPPEVSTAAGSPTVILQGWVPLLGIVVALLAPLGPSILNLWITHRNGRRINAVDAHTSRKLDIIHNLVNSRLTAALNKIDDLERRLMEQEDVIPPDDYTDGPAAM